MKKKLDVLYIHPTKKLENKIYSIMPVGVFALVNNLKLNGFKVEGINNGAEKSVQYYYSLEEDIKNYEYKVLLIDLHWYEHSYGAIEVAKLSKSINPQIPIVIGGFTSTIYGEEILQEFKEIDYVIKGDSEEPLLKLVNYIVNGEGLEEEIPNLCYRKNNKIINKDITYCCANIDELDYVNNDFVKNSELCYYAGTTGIRIDKLKSYWLCIGRGCIYNCSYCCGSRKNGQRLFGRDKMIVRSPEVVAKDIKWLAEKGVNIINPTHDFEMFGEEYYSKLFNLMVKDKVKVGTYIECFQLPSKKFIEALLSAFDKKLSSIEISPLCGNESLRRFNGKNFSNEQLYSLLEFLANNDVNLELYYSLNLPGETEESLNETLKQMEYIIERYPSRILTIFCQRVALDPLAPMREKPYGITSKVDTFLDYYNYCKSSSEIYTGYVEASDLEIMKKVKIYDEFKKRMKAYAKEENLHFRII